MRFWTVCVAGFCCLSAAGARADLVGHGGFVKGVAISPDGRHALTASFDYSVMYWSLPDGGREGRFDGHEGGVNAVAFLPDGDHAISGADDGTMILWSLADGAVIRTYAGHTGKIAAVAVSPDGKLAASAAWDRTIRLWDVGTGEDAAGPERPRHEFQRGGFLAGWRAAVIRRA